MCNCILLIKHKKNFVALHFLVQYFSNIRLKRKDNNWYSALTLLLKAKAIIINATIFNIYVYLIYLTLKVYLSTELSTSYFHDNTRVPSIEMDNSPIFILWTLLVMEKNITQENIWKHILFLHMWICQNVH